MFVRIVVINEQGVKEFHPWHTANISLISLNFLVYLNRNKNYYLEYSEVC